MSFIVPSPMRWDRFRKPRFIVVYPLVAYLFAFARITEASLKAGIVLILLGEALRFWADGYIGHRKVNRAGNSAGNGSFGELVTAGPYAFVRHPLYLGTFLIGAGFCVAMGSLWFGLVALGSFFLVYRSTMAKEESLLKEERTAEYLSYHSAVPRFFPFRPPYPHRKGRWSWQGIRASQEWKTVLWLTVVVILAYFWKETVQEKRRFLDEHWVFRSFLMGLLLFLVGAAVFYEWVKMRAKPPA